MQHKEEEEEEESLACMMQQSDRLDDLALYLMDHILGSSSHGPPQSWNRRPAADTREHDAHDDQVYISNDGDGDGDGDAHLMMIRLSLLWGKLEEVYHRSSKVQVNEDIKGCDDDGMLISPPLKYIIQEQEPNNILFPQKRVENVVKDSKSSYVTGPLFMQKEKVNYGNAITDNEENVAVDDDGGGISLYGLFAEQGKQEECSWRDEHDVDEHSDSMLKYNHRFANCYDGGSGMLYGFFTDKEEQECMASNVGPDNHADHDDSIICHDHEFIMYRHHGEEETTRSAMEEEEESTCTVEAEEDNNDDTCTVTNYHHRFEYDDDDGEWSAIEEEEESGTCTVKDKEDHICNTDDEKEQEIDADADADADDDDEYDIIDAYEDGNNKMDAECIDNHCCKMAVSYIDHLLAEGTLEDGEKEQEHDDIAISIDAYDGSDEEDDDIAIAIDAYDGSDEEDVEDINNHCCINAMRNHIGHLLAEESFHDIDNNKQLYYELKKPHHEQEQLEKESFGDVENNKQSCYALRKHHREQKEQLKKEVDEVFCKSTDISQGMVTQLPRDELLVTDESCPTTEETDHHQMLAQYSISHQHGLKTAMERGVDFIDNSAHVEHDYVFVTDTDVLSHQQHEGFASIEGIWSDISREECIRVKPKTKYKDAFLRVKKQLF